MLVVGIQFPSSPLPFWAASTSTSSTLPSDPFNSEHLG
jgi:hypothetical protein